MHDDLELDELRRRFDGLTEAIREHAARYPGRDEPADEASREQWRTERTAWRAEWARLWAEQRELARAIHRRRAEAGSA
ncbi:hypothetical protein [Embleya sp. AB8]|uniref:hypothetical protein n=1 Tax=Embleya sp. AB8 TaxID=3156304 RepID=UPI003C76C116